MSALWASMAGHRLHPGRRHARVGFFVLGLAHEATQRDRPDEQAPVADVITAFDAVVDTAIREAPAGVC